MSMAVARRRSFSSRIELANSAHFASTKRGKLKKLFFLLRLVASVPRCSLVAAKANEEEKDGDDEKPRFLSFPGQRRYGVDMEEFADEERSEKAAPKKYTRRRRW